MDVMLILAVLAVVATVVGWGIHRHLYVKKLTERGWTFITSPSIAIVFGLNVPPFGVGFGRSVDDQITGAASDGTPFSAFEYAYDGWRSPGYMVTVPLPRPLPEGEVYRDDAPQLPLGPAVSRAGVSAASPDARLADALLDAAAGLQGPWRITVDGETLVLVGAGKQPDELAAAVEALASVRTRLLASPAATLEAPSPPEMLSFHRRPSWSYAPRDDTALAQVRHTRDGHSHQAVDVIRSANDGLPFVRLRHEWKTTHTHRDANGHTRTETRRHSEELCEFRTTFPFQDLSVNWGLFGDVQRFEWEDFNRRFKVRAASARFASDVMHQRQMEWLMACDPRGFEIERGRISVDGGGSGALDFLGVGGTWAPADVARVSDFLHGFFARVPDFVWQNLGAWPRPIPELPAPSEPSR